MERIFLVKYGEIILKGENQQRFLHALKLNIKRKLRGIPTVMRHKPGRIYLQCNEDDTKIVAAVLSNTFGIVGFSLAYNVEKNMEKIEQAVREIAREEYTPECGRKFKVACRRTDKSFELGSYQIACRLGGVLLEQYPELSVSLNHPDWVINVEIREKAYIYGIIQKGPGGLPVSCAGRGLLLLSGGIDSPVAGYLMGKRGLDIDVIYFHTPPFTSEKSLEKVKQLAGLLSVYFRSLHLYVIPFTTIQKTINEKANNNEITLHGRASMMCIADKLAKKNGYNCLITGESLSQVASQTPESIRYTGSFTDLPVFRPLIGMDKEEIITIARKINTFETSIQPHPDCCTLFAPAHPLLKPELGRMQAVYRDLQLEPLLDEALAAADIIPADPSAG